MNSKKILALVLIGLTVVVGGAAIYLGIRLAQKPQDLPETGTRTFPNTSYTCSGRCNSGSECNGYGDPPVGQMWSCYQNPNDGYKYECAYEAINSGGNSCYLSCSTGTWQPCGCDQNKCVSECLAGIGPGQSRTYTINCDSCQQKFTCECSKPPTTPPGTTPPRTTPPGTTPPSTTPPGTTPPRTTPPGTTPPRTTPPGTTPPGTTPPRTTPPGTTPPRTTPPTTTVVQTTPPETTPPTTTTIPKTALVSDEADRMILGIALLVIGLALYKSGLYLNLGNLLWNRGGSTVWGGVSTTGSMFNSGLGTAWDNLVTADTHIEGFFMNVAYRAKALLALIKYTLLSAWDKISIFFLSLTSGFLNMLLSGIRAVKKTVGFFRAIFKQVGRIRVRKPTRKSNSFEERILEESEEE